MDDATRSYLQLAVAREVDLPEQMAGRLRGDDVGSLRRDAEQLHRDLYGEPERARGADGKFAGKSDMTRLIRQRAGRG